MPAMDPAPDQGAARSRLARKADAARGGLQRGRHPYPYGGEPVTAAGGLAECAIKRYR